MHRLQPEVIVDGRTDLHEELGHVADCSDRYSNSIRTYVGIGDQIHHAALLSDNADIGDGILFECPASLRIKYVTFFHLIRRFQLHLPVGVPDSHHVVGGHRDGFPTVHSESHHIEPVMMMFINIGNGRLNFFTAFITALQDVAILYLLDGNQRPATGRLFLDKGAVLETSFLFNFLFFKLDVLCHLYQISS